MLKRTYGSLTFLPPQNFTVFDGYYFLGYYLRRCVREAGDLCALKTDIEKKIKTKKQLFEETDWRFRFDATHIRNVTVIIFEDCNDEEHVASAVYKV